MKGKSADMQQALMQRHIRPELVMCLGFLALILVGGILLSLPAASVSGASVGFGNGIFTATSAVCVTGLVVVDTGTTYSLFGQIVLLLLMQAGGLGFMVFATLVMVALGRRITLRDRMLIRESLNTTTLSGLVRLICWYGLLALEIELLGAIALSTRFVPMYGWSKGLWFSIWHAVSAFCNAGFDLFGGYSSLTAFARDPVVLLTVAFLIILGGTGFAVISEMLDHRLKWRKFSLHARLALSMTLALIVGGTLAIALLEWNNPATLGSVGGGGYRLLNAFFQSVTMRTAGFNTVDLAAMADGTKLLCILMMLIGANPASTGGGVKTTTVAVVMLAVWSVIRGNQDTVIHGRRIPVETVRRAIAVMVVTLLIFLTGTLLLTIGEQGQTDFVDVVFETASAMGTVGVSSAGTPGLSLMSKIVLVPVMYLGRVGTLTLAFGLANRQDERHARLRYPEENVTIG